MMKNQWLFFLSRSNRPQYKFLYKSALIKLVRKAKQRWHVVRADDDALSSSSSRLVQASDEEPGVARNPE